MPKELVELHENSREQLLNHPEIRMGAYIVKGRLESDTADRIHVIAGRFYVVPDEHESYYSISDMLAGEPFPTGPAATLNLAVTSVTGALNTVTLPIGFVPTAGAIPLLGSVTLGKAKLFFRFCALPSDPRYVAGKLLKGSYLTTANDRGYANTGFAAVGRYALPIPVPASNLFPYQLPAGTQLLVGTALPSFGQAGGGVEVQLQGDVSLSPLKSTSLDDF